METPQYCTRCSKKLPPDGICLRCAFEELLAQPDDQIGPYKLIEELGKGGMGAVWKAEQIESIKRTVALKIVKAGMESQPVLLRFEAERQTLAMMNHNNIARVLDAGSTTDGRPYFVMELVDGEPITRFCDKRRLRIRERLGLFRQVCRAIQHAHKKGIIHRDIKPGNVLVTECNGEFVPKVIDFGIAKAIRPDLSKQPALNNLPPTISGTFFGTPEYISPEQAKLEQREIGTYSDIYSLGVLLYELLTGTTPLTRESMRFQSLDEKLRRVREEEVPPLSLRLIQMGERLTSIASRRGVKEAGLKKCLRRNGDLDRIVQKCLEKSSATRYETVDSLAVNVKRYLNGEPVDPPPPGRFYPMWKFILRHKLAFAAGTAIAVSLILALSITWTANVRLSKERENTREALTRFEMQVAEEAFRDDDAATGLAYLAGFLRRNTNNALAAERIVSALTYRNFLLPVLEHYQRRAWGQAKSDSKGMRFLAVSNSVVRVWDAATGGHLCTLQHPNDNVQYVEFSPDSRQVVTRSAGGLLLWDIETGGNLPKPKAIEEVPWRMSKPGAPSAPTIRFSGTPIMADVANCESGLGGLKEGLSTTGRYSANLGSSTASNLLTNSDEGLDFASSAMLSPDQSCKVEICHEVGSKFESVRLLDLRNEFLSEPIKCRYFGTDTRFSPDGKRLFVSSHNNADYRLGVWDASVGRAFGRAVDLSGNRPDWRNSATRFAYFNQGEHSGRARLSADGSSVLIHFSSFFVVDLKSGKVALKKGWRAGSVADFTPSGNGIVSALSAESGTRALKTNWVCGPTQLFGYTNKVVNGTNKPEPCVVTIGAAGETRAKVTRILAHKSTISIRDCKTWEPKFKPFTIDGEVTSIIASSDGQKVLTSLLANDDLTPTSEEPTVCLWDLKTGEPVISAFKPGGRIGCMTLSPDGKRILTASNDKKATIWNITGRRASPFSTFKHSGTMSTAQFSRDGRRVVTASEDGTACVWDVRTGRPLGRPMRHLERVCSAQFSPDERRIVTASNDRTARIWDAATGQALSEPLKHDSQVVLAQFINGGQQVVTIAGTTARIWDTSTPPPRVEQWFIDLIEGVAGQRLTEEGLFEYVPVAQLLNSKERLWAANGTDFYTQWAKWFFADRSTRAISPGSEVTFPSYKEALMQMNTAESLAEAEQLAVGDAALRERISKARLALKLTD